MVGLALVVAGCTGGATTDQAAGYKNITAEQLKRMMDKKDFLLVDVHVPEQRRIVKTDLAVPFDQIERNAAKFPKDKSKKIVLYCRGGHMSQEAAQRLFNMGYTDVYNLVLGAAAWEAAGYPMAQ